MQIYITALWLLSCTLSNAAVAEISAAKNASSLAHRQLLVDAFDAKLPRLPAWKRALGASARVGPPRRSLASQAEALETTQRVLATHNARHAAGDESYFLSWNALSDLSRDDYERFLTSRVDSPAVHKSRGLHSVYTRLGPPPQNHGLSFTFHDQSKWHTGIKDSPANTDTTPLPKNYNWLEIDNGKYLTPIKNQGSCGSCWAFSAVSVIESQFAIAHNQPATPLSVEQVLSCSAPLDHIPSKFPDMAASSKGCEGGMPFLAFEYMARVEPYGIACATDYPYVMATSVSETQCQAVQSPQVAVAWTKGSSDYVAVTPNSEEALMRAVMVGPVSSNIDALGEGFRHYGGGIYDARDCASDGKAINHAVVIVGFGETAAGDKYWVLRNTWGTMWGENGYMRLARGTTAAATGPCNLYMFSTYPVKLAKGEGNQDGVCPTPLTDYAPLGWTKLMGYDGGAWGLLVGLAFACVIGGGAFFVGSEVTYKRKAAAGVLTYDDNYARWVLPTKEQIAAMLARRRPQTESV